MNTFETEGILVAALSDCLPVCTVQGVNDYGDVLRLAPMLATARTLGPGRKQGAVFVYYLGDNVDRAPANTDCYSWTQTWVVAVTSVNKCDLAHGTLARRDNGILTAHTVCCLACVSDLVTGKPLLKRVAAPQYPLFEQSAGLAVTLLAYEVRIRIDCSNLPPFL